MLFFLSSTLTGWWLITLVDVKKNSSLIDHRQVFVSESHSQVDGDSCWAQFPFQKIYFVLRPLQNANGKTNKYCLFTAILTVHFVNESHFYHSLNHSVPYWSTFWVNSTIYRLHDFFCFKIILMMLLFVWLLNYM